MNNTITTNTNSNTKKDNLLQTIINVITVVCFFIIVVVIYKLFIKDDYDNLRREGFKVKKDKFENTNDDTTDTNATSSNTVYEKALNDIYGDNHRLLCSMLPTVNENSNICKVDNIPYIIYKYPIHMIKLNDSSILAVFNDGRMYQKDSMESTMWKGPIQNSMPQGTIPLRMVTLATDLTTLLGVAYNNILYVKEPLSESEGGGINLSGSWKQVPNNSNIIYILFDNTTNNLISIDINGKLFTKTSSDITGENQELVTLLDRPVLRLYYDLNGYMLAIDNQFDLYQFTDIDWKNTPLQTSRGANPNKLQDVLYDNDGKMYGLVFNPDAFMVQIMKQSSVFYLSAFNTLDKLITNKDKTNFVMSDQDILKSKIGSLYDYINTNSIKSTTDDDPNFAYQKQIMNSKAQLRQFCANRGSNTQNINYENYDLLSNVETNNDKIDKLKNIIKNLMSYEPERMNIQEKYAILNK